MEQEHSNIATQVGRSVSNIGVYSARGMAKGGLANPILDYSA